MFGHSTSQPPASYIRQSLLQRRQLSQRLPSRGQRNLEPMWAAKLSLKTTRSPPACEVNPLNRRAVWSYGVLMEVLARPTPFVLLRGDVNTAGHARMARMWFFGTFLHGRIPI